MACVVASVALFGVTVLSLTRRRRPKQSSATHQSPATTFLASSPGPLPIAWDKILSTVTETLPENIEEKRNAYVTVLTSSSKEHEYAIMAEVLGQQLSKFMDKTTTDYVAVRTPKVSLEVTKYLEQSPVVDRVLTLDPSGIIENIEALWGEPATKDCWVKLRFWHLVEYAHIIVLDLDILPLQSFNPIFNIPGFAASHYIGGYDVVEKGMNTFNIGLFKLDPDLAEFERLLVGLEDYWNVHRKLFETSAPKKSWAYKADQPYLNWYFQKRAVILPVNHAIMVKNLYLPESNGQSALNIAMRDWHVALLSGPRNGPDAMVGLHFGGNSKPFLPMSKLRKPADANSTLDQIVQDCRRVWWDAHDGLCKRRSLQKLETKFCLTDPEL